MVPPKAAKLPWVIAAVAAMGGGGAWYFEHEKAQQVSAAAESTDVQADETKKMGPITELETFVVNLTSHTGSINYLKATLAVELSHPKWVPVIETNTVAVRDATLLYLSSLTVDDTVGTGNKERIRAALTNQIGARVGDGAVRNIYLTEFLIQ